MNNTKEHIVNVDAEARVALRALDLLKDFVSRTLFVVNNSHMLVGTLTDGDIRRGLLSGLEISQTIELFMNSNFKFLKSSQDNIAIIKEYKRNGIQLVPLIDDNFQLLEVIDLTKTKTLLPVTALIMAGGRGERLSPFTDTCPKPMLKVGNKPIIEHNIDRLIACGISEIFISVKYLKEQIMDYFGNGSSKGIKINYIEENVALGTLGALSMMENFSYQDLLVMNSDLLTNIDFEDFFSFYKECNACMVLASIPYVVNVPYAVLDTNGSSVRSFSEKPTYTYYSNGGIYLLKASLKKYVTKGSFYNATDMMDSLIHDEKHHLIHYPLLGYWLDIGKHQDFIKAQEDIKHINLG